MATELNIVIIGGVKYWIKRPYHPQPRSVNMPPELGNWEPPAVGSPVCGASFLDRTSKPRVHFSYDVLAPWRKSC